MTTLTDKQLRKLRDQNTDRLLTYPVIDLTAQAEKDYNNLVEENECISAELRRRAAERL